MTSAQFAEKIGISSSSLSHILGGRNNPSLDVVTKIYKAYDCISLNWLLFGEGEMETDVDTGNTIGNSPTLFDENPEFSGNSPHVSENRKENDPLTSTTPLKEIVREEIKYIETPAKKITEIRVFYDNGTYETFVPGN